MVNYLNILENPQINFEKTFEVMRDFRMGGINPTMYDEFLNTVKKLPNIRMRGPLAYNVFDKFNLTDITQDNFTVIQKEVMKRGIRTSKICWHPEASPSMCKVDGSGEIIVSAAHSIQNNGILSEISENGIVMGYTFKKGKIVGEEVQKNFASTFLGFCNIHDSIFYPIETVGYSNSQEQNFLFAYRGFVIASHKKREVSTSQNFEDQSVIDIIENKKKFDKAIQLKDYSIIESEVFELPQFYPIAASSSFYLDFDFEGNSIPHSDSRMENVFVTLLPKQKENKTYFILSYFQQDKQLYKNLGEQLRKRDNLKSDITMIIIAHTNNVYFNPVYYKTFIEEIQDIIQKIVFQTQMDHGVIDGNNKIQHQFSMTPENYLTNPDKISIFGY
ncbi:hypothetical protein [Flavobacterium sp. AED]|uniref:hypothetical protein n=1 Tax=Flavobacterium sp. AED TaxID=1423323 RepID=UPI00057EBE4A|nr:hypothetical protein [Flavobacterium sp. AED]KIA82418.1 hypothetical protein OA85_16245 [Flavobacterium sp. AED]